MTEAERRSERDALLRLMAGFGWGPLRIGRLLELFGSPEGVLAASHSDVTGIRGFGDGLYGTLQKARDVDVEPVLRRTEAIGAGIVTWRDPDYPVLLRESYHPPPLLWARPYPDGLRLLGDRIAIAVVGSRRCTPYGRRMARAIGADLASRDLVVVSGLALGIDSEGHRGALEANGETVAVMGCGVDRVYPPSHHELAGRILETGAMISEYPPGTNARPGHFPERNRIIAGMAKAVVIVEANQPGGALITAKFAQAENRDLFAVPGRVDSPASRGALRLICDGAHPVIEPPDVVRTLWPDLFPGPVEPVLTVTERTILDALTVHPSHVDRLVETTGLPVSTLLVGLLKLEMRGSVRQLAGRHFCRTGAVAA